MYNQPLATITLSILALGFITSPARADLADVAKGVSTTGEILRGISTLTQPQPKVSNAHAPVPQQRPGVPQQLAPSSQLPQQLAPIPQQRPGVPQQLAPAPQQLAPSPQVVQQRPRPTAVDVLHEQVDGMLNLANWAGKTLFP